MFAGRKVANERRSVDENLESRVEETGVAEIDESFSGRELTWPPYGGIYRREEEGGGRRHGCGSRNERFRWRRRKGRLELKRRGESVRLAGDDGRVLRRTMGGSLG